MRGFTSQVTWYYPRHQVGQRSRDRLTCFSFYRESTREREQTIKSVYVLLRTDSLNSWAVSSAYFREDPARLITRGSLFFSVSYLSPELHHMSGSAGQVVADGTSQHRLRIKGFQRSLARAVPYVCPSLA
ncbi:hypothetical protein J6590_034191 [Homalodisca vitripennis]|nr:hypothetical protein J6590_034191 [Homalodisca vitripennis]